jgi:hypothetical protein
MNQRVLELLNEKTKLAEKLPKSKQLKKNEADQENTRMALDSMKLTQLDDLSRIRPHNELKRFLASSNFLAFTAFIAGIGNEYFTPGHTNSYCFLLGYCSTMLFTMGAGGFFGL